MFRSRHAAAPQFDGVPQEAAPEATSVQPLPKALNAAREASESSPAQISAVFTESQNPSTALRSDIFPSPAYPSQRPAASNHLRALCPAADVQLRRGAAGSADFHRS